MTTHLVVYTTRYREGGEAFRRAARTRALELMEERGARVDCRPVESKRDLVEALAAIERAGGKLRQLHFFGHSGMYGPMFRSSAMPEQFSPHEWRTLGIPFAEDGEAFFHCCRSGRWFAPFFARTFGVPAWGYHLYTTVSRRRDRYLADLGGDGPLHVIAVPGKKSHGLAGSVGKHLGLLRAEAMTRHLPTPVEDASYDPVAELYDAAFADIGVRKVEVGWIEAHLPPSPRLLEIGCGNGALLQRLAPRLSEGVGVDASAGMLARARARNAGVPALRFEQIRGPQLPLPDRSVDVVLSMLSWRYLDWDPMMQEVRRVLAPGGRLLVVDMVALPAAVGELPGVALNLARDWMEDRRHPEWVQARRRLVEDPRWARMLQYNPIRADHEYRWYFESRFPGRKLETLSRAHTTRVVAFDTGALEPGWTLPQSYP